MALTGLQIFKYLPGGKKEKEANCKKCGFPTCMAFAMKLAKKETTVDKCEYITDELKALLDEANQLQQAEIRFGFTANQVITGNETVMFRHDKTFVNQTCFAVKIESSDTDFTNKLEEILSYTVERVGQNLKVDAITLYDCDSTFVEKAGTITKSSIPLILVSSNADNIEKALEISSGLTPLVYFDSEDTDKLSEISKKYTVPVVVSANDIEKLADESSKLLEDKIESLVLNVDSSVNNLIENLTYIRRSAIEDKFKPLGYPVITFMDKITNQSDDITDKTVLASALVCKYSNIIVLDTFDKAQIYTLLTLRQNIYTDPQKPLQMEPKVYSIGDVDENSPIIVTTNFALTYFSVVGEVESTNIPTYLLITPSDGMSVLTAWAASKFTGETIAKAVKEADLENLVKHRKIIIPGYVGTLKQEIEEELPGWEVIVGSNEAVDIPDFLKEFKAAQMIKS